METLSIVIPAYNEATTITKTLDRIRAVELIRGIRKEVIVMDDCSKDQTREVVLAYRDANKDLTLQYFRNEQNQGKGYSVARGIEKATGDYLIVQDADLEYDPSEYNLLLSPVVSDKADVVYGSRFMGGSAHRVLFFWHSIGNHFLTFLSNLATNLNLTDMETGYKLFRKDVISKIILREPRFGFEPEVTAKLSKIKGIRIYEVGISYYGRTYDEGKKINWKDGVKAIYCIFRYNYF